MAILQQPPLTESELEASKPLEIAPEEVQKFTETEWYERAYRGDVPQLTLRAVAMGTFLGFFLSFTNIYIGLKTGWFLGVNLTACILSFTFSTSLHKSGLWKTPMSILENTCMVSTASSAGYATGNSLVSAIPAMLMLTVTVANPGGTHKPWWVLGPWVFFLAILGVTIAIPLKRSLINRERLKFPSGTAAAVTLQGLYSRGEEALAKARVLGAFAVVSAVWKVLTDLQVLKHVDAATQKIERESLLPDSSKAFDWIKGLLPTSLTENARMFRTHSFKFNKETQTLDPWVKDWNFSDWTMRLDHSFVLLAAGMIVGVRTTVWMVVGGLFLVIFLGPHALENVWQNASGNWVGAATSAGKAWKEIGIWLGAPLMVAHGLTAFAGQWRSIARAVGGLTKKTVAAQSPYRVTNEQGTEVDTREVEVPTAWFIGGVAIAAVGLIVMGWMFMEIPPQFGALAVLMTFLLGIVSCRATGETDITPGGAMGKIMQLTFGKLIPQSYTANLMTASVTSGAGLAAADLLNDLKSGYLLGANPRRQFLAQAAGIVTGAIASTIGFFMLVPDATALLGVDGKDPSFPAPGAQQWKAVAELFKYGIENLHPMARTMIPIGLVVGAGLAALELAFPKHKKYIPAATGIGLGLILPFTAPLSMFLGAVIAEIAAKVNKGWAEKYIIPISAGTIAGESIVGVIVAGLNNTVFH
ncbi:MAG: OPT/YSL family transporter [Polyangiaceae bacterium]|nr:OPT/YSL family transporter [Polyangiaceae bacterium]